MPEPIRKKLKIVRSDTEHPPDSIEQYAHNLAVFIELNVFRYSSFKKSKERRLSLENDIKDFLVNNPSPVSEKEFCNFVEAQAKKVWETVPRYAERIWGISPKPSDNKPIMTDNDFKKLRQNLTNILQKGHRAI